MTEVIIYKPNRHTMQMGTGKTKSWILEYVPDATHTDEKLMGWVSSGQTNTQLNLHFKSLDAAETYAKSKNLRYSVMECNSEKTAVKNYAVNFANNRLR